MKLYQYTILIVDDNELDAQTFQRFLKQDAETEYSFFWAEVGEEGLELCQENQVDCILLDFMLPDMNGLEFLETLHEMYGELPCAIVMLTGQGDESVAVQAMQLGVQDYLVKQNVTVTSIHRTVHNALSKEAAARKIITQQEALEEKNRELEAFAYTVAHDLRQPLKGINDYATVLGEHIRQDLDIEDSAYIDYIIAASGRMGRLVNDLLAYSRLGHDSVEREWLPLSKLLCDVRSDLSARIEEKQAEIIIPPDLPTVYGNSTLISQIFANLFNNALNYHRPEVSPRIEVKAHAQLEHVLISVADNGVGIPKEAYQKVFALFQRLHGGSKHPGTGIGLATVKKLIDLMGGEIWLESVVGQGTTFHLQFPTRDNQS